MRQDSCALVAVLPLRRPPPSPTCRWRRGAAGWTRRWARLRTRSRSSLNSGAPPFPHHNTWGRKNKDLELLFKKLHKKRSRNSVSHGIVYKKHCRRPNRPKNWMPAFVQVTAEILVQAMSMSNLVSPLLSNYSWAFAKFWASCEETVSYHKSLVGTSRQNHEH